MVEFHRCPLTEEVPLLACVSPLLNGTPSLPCRSSDGYELEEVEQQDGTLQLQCRTPQICYGDTVSCGGWVGWLAAWGRCLGDLRTHPWRHRQLLALCLSRSSAVCLPQVLRGYQPV